MTVEDLLKRFEGKLVYVSGKTDNVIDSVEYDSRKVSHKSLFVAVKGLVSDGHDYVRSLDEKGVPCVIVSSERASEFSELKCCVISADDTRAALSYVSAYFFGEVSLSIPVIGITGTNGKTSTTYMLEALFSNAGYNPGVIGTVAYRWNGNEIPAPNTTPESRDLHKLFHDMKNDGVDCVIMEVSSHGLALGRVNDIAFQGAVFTNLTRDHLDYHKTFEEYFEAKKILFRLLEKSPRQNKFACINHDDEYGMKILESRNDYSYPFYSFGLSGDADFFPVKNSLITSISTVKYSVKHKKSVYHVNLPMGGKFSFYNSLAAFSAASAFGMNGETAAEGFALIKNVPGRFERVDADCAFSVIVDYAHTNDAMEKLLSSAKELNPSKLITVFGCGGDRDKTKRPLMGEVAGKYSDTAIVTSDNPRTENPEAIISDILAGMEEYKGKTIVEIDREKAIRYAISIAEKDSVVVIAGKGHEDYQIIGTEKHHFDDREIARKYMELSASLSGAVN
ncbi:MAG TPA: UDP-N-acetylmuramoyl-L-alanyl-D-glutamate--2,6-diaminopimelate ligase [Spirochaetota bacterium]|nr:UDP-N-acetylmuramoyl-L-alanyl-D-glutamate--2,6-diaminopimelate ligase [Spirochaetota bacterium]HQE58208.1 UDP-N-acetylmuramoyl-L-alanyl-D-glutamate--2,6-diaminopimelate ligase [Spirochaetota bacterium]